MAYALLPQDLVHGADGSPIFVEELLNARHQSHIRRAIIPPPARAFDRFDLRKTAFPKPQHMRGDGYGIRHF